MYIYIYTCVRARAHTIPCATNKTIQKSKLNSIESKSMEKSDNEITIHTLYKVLILCVFLPSVMKLFKIYSFLGHEGRISGHTPGFPQDKMVLGNGAQVSCMQIMYLVVLGAMQLSPYLRLNSSPS